MSRLPPIYVFRSVSSPFLYESKQAAVRSTSAVVLYKACPIFCNLLQQALFCNLLQQALFSSYDGRPC